MDDIENPVVNVRWTWLDILEVPLKFCEFWPEFQENHSKFCKVLEFPKILNE